MTKLQDTYNLIVSHITADPSREFSTSDLFTVVNLHRSVTDLISRGTVLNAVRQLPTECRRLDRVTNSFFVHGAPLLPTSVEVDMTVDLQARIDRLTADLNQIPGVTATARIERATVTITGGGGGGDYGSCAYNYETLKLMSKEAGGRVTDYLALAPKNDPFYAGTPADLAKGNWFANVYTRAGYSELRAPHLRRVHYWTVSQEPPVPMPDGKPYENTEKCWEFLIEAGKAARYLGLVAMNGIVDNKNPNPHVNALYWDSDPGFQIQVPELANPQIDLYGLWDTNVQPYHLEVWCEKSTMNDVLLPVCQRFNANLVTFEGEVSITAVCVNLMRRIESSGGKPTRILYISDFDPAGNSMPVAMSRKLEYALHQAGNIYDVKVNPVALTVDQIKRYRLPRIPIKETETRGAKFEAAFGLGAVELDALEALHPGTLAQIVRKVLALYYSIDANREIAEKTSRLRQAVETEAAAVTAKYTKEIEALKAMQDELKAITLDLTPYEVERYEPHVDPDDEDDWLFDSERDYIEQIRYYKAHKIGADVGGGGGFMTCPSCGSDEISYSGIDDGGGDYGDSVCDQYECNECGYTFEDNCVDGDESDYAQSVTQPHERIDLTSEPPVDDGDTVIFAELQPMKCPKCDGIGWVQGQFVVHECDECKGSGIVTAEHLQGSGGGDEPDYVFVPTRRAPAVYIPFRWRIGRKWSEAIVLQTLKTLTMQGLVTAYNDNGTFRYTLTPDGERYLENLS